MTRVLLRGGPEALARALDVFLVQSEVLGVVERDGEIELAVTSPAERLPSVDSVDLEILPEIESPTGLEHDAAIRVGDSILIRPPWVEAPADFHGTELVVPRGGAFGSGEHGSTQAALLALDAVWDPATRVFADIGTGSGILALYAAVRGVAEILACDVDPAAVRAARELLPMADVRVGGAEVFGRAAADAVVANLSGAELAGALDAVLALWSGRAPLVLSGMRPHEVDGIEARVTVAAAPRRQRYECSGFVALAFGPYTS